MRRKDREVTDRQEILSILNKCVVGHVAMVDETGLPYLLPINFAWEDVGGRLRIYLHCAKEGRKLEILKQNPQICFEADCGHALAEAKNACAYGFWYESVMGWGKARFVEDTGEKCHALTLLMKHQTGKDFAFEPKDAAIVEVLCLEIETLTGKRRMSK